MHDNLHAVAAVYEDRHLLCSFGPQAQLLQRSIKARRVKVSRIRTAPVFEWVRLSA